MAQKNIFAQFAGHEVKTATIEALDGAEIKYRTLTIKEADDFQKKMIKSFNDEGKPELNFDAMSKVRNEKIALCLIEPKMTVKELEELSAEAGKALAEIEALVSELESEITNQHKTGKELLDALKSAGIVGIWKDREDIKDSAEFARKLRNQAESRGE